MTFSAIQWYQPQGLTRRDYTHYLEQLDNVARSKAALVQKQAQCQEACKQVVNALIQMLSAHPAKDILFYSMGNISSNTPVKALLADLSGLTETQFVPKSIKIRLNSCCEKYIKNALGYGADQYSERGQRAASVVNEGIEAGLQLQDDLAKFHQTLDDIQSDRDRQKTALDECQLALKTSRPSLVLYRAYATSLKTALHQMEAYARQNQILGIPSLCAKLKDTNPDELSSAFLEHEITTYKTLPQGPLHNDMTPPALLLKELHILFHRFGLDKTAALSPTFDEKWLQAMATSAEFNPNEESKAQPSESRALPANPPNNAPKSLSSHFQLNCLFGLGAGCTLTSAGLLIAIVLGATASALPIAAAGLGVAGLGMLAYAFFKQCKSYDDPELNDPLPVRAI